MGTSRDTASTTMGKDKEGKDCKCDCSQQGAMKSRPRASGRTTTESRRSTSTDANAPRDLGRDSTGASSHSACAAITVPAQVRKSLAENSWPVTLRR